MRMWLVNPKVMCRQHLLGEHCEMHMFLGCMAKGKNLKGYISKGLLEPTKLFERHTDLYREMERRGYKHDSQMYYPLTWRYSDFGIGKIDVEKNLIELSNRCENCKKLGRNKE